MYKIIFHSDAINEILNQTKRGAIRSEISGAYGWKSAPKVNSRLFGNTLIQAIQTNRRKTAGGIAKSSNRNAQGRRTSPTKNKFQSTIKSSATSKNVESPSMKRSSDKPSIAYAQSTFKKDDIL